jgi:hypothetical protein
LRLSKTQWHHPSQNKDYRKLQITGHESILTLPEPRTNLVSGISRQNHAEPPGLAPQPIPLNFSLICGLGPKNLLSLGYLQITSGEP